MKKSLKLIISLCFAVVAGLAVAEPIYIRQVPKGTGGEFMSRFVARDYHIIVSRRPSRVFLRQIVTQVVRGKALYVLEARNYRYPPQRGEIGRIDTFIFLVLDEPEDGSLPAPYNEGDDHLEKATDSSSFSWSRRAQGGSFSQQPLAEKFVIDADYLRFKLEQFSGEKPIRRESGDLYLSERKTSASRKLARDFLAAEYQAMGYVVTIQEYSSGHNKGANLIAERKGENPRGVVIVGAHYDTVGTRGADDDGSGTIAALTIARAMSHYRFDHTVRFLAFDQEELGLVGSEAYVKQLTKAGGQPILGVIGMDVVGYDSDNDGMIHVIDCNENTSEQLAALVMSTLSAQGLGLTRADYCTGRSDHASFWRADIPAVLISENYFAGDPNPCMHKSCDTIQNINFDYMANITRLAGASAAALLVPANIHR